MGAIDKLGNETASVDLDVRNFEIDTVRPADPVLLSPMGLINDATPLLDWDHPDTADVVEYVVFVRTADDRGPPPLIVAFITGDPPETQFQIPDQDALQDDRYVWEVWALDRADNVGFSETGDFTVDTQIAQPILKKPEQGDRVGNPTPTFEWTHSGDANPLNHYIRVSLGDISSPPAFEDEIQTEVLGLTLVGATPISVLPIGPGGTADYFWQVTVTDGVNTAESPVGRFILDLNVPVIRLDSPVAPDNILTSGDVVFRWSAVDIEPLFAGLGIGIQAIDPDFYDLRVAWATGDILSDFFHQEPDIEHTGDRDSRQVFPLLLSPPAPLGDGQYVWAVRGKKDELVGEFTEAPFIVDLVQPGTPVLQSPGSGDKISDNQPVFEWSSVSDTSGVTYIFELTSGDFAAPRFVAVVGSPSITPLDPLPDGDYMWRVYAVDGAGRTGNFSTVFNLTVDTAPPAPPVLVAPAQDAVVAAAKPTFQWQAATGDVADYRIQVTSGDIHTGPYDIDVVIAQPTTNFQAADDLLDGSYSWRVIASDAALNTASSEVGTFTVQTSALSIQQIVLKTGWNLMSLSVEPVESSPDELLKDAGTFSIFQWNPLSQSYSVPEALRVGQGYWVAVFQDSQVVIEGTPVGPYEAVTAKGWNLIGGTFDEAQVTVISGGPVASNMFRWDPSSQGYISTSTLVPGFGHWLAAFDAATVAVTPLGG